MAASHTPGQQGLVGLLGELQVLAKLLEHDDGLLAAWRAPADGLHDFEWRGRAIEVKTSLGPSAQVRISRLDQLDDAGLDQLHLLHVRLFEDPAGVTLNQVVAGIHVLMPAEAVRRDFQNALLRHGLPPGDDIASSSLRVTLHSMSVWRVTDGFGVMTSTLIDATLYDKLERICAKRGVE
jgi:hypothetical protein